MSKIGRFVLIVVLASSSALEAADAEQKAAALPGSRFVAIAPCRILDTHVKRAANSAEEFSRRINVRATRCGRILPPYATSYSIRLTTYGRTMPAGSKPITHPSTVPVPLDGHLEVAVPPESYVGVDVDGYWVAPGTPVDPGTAAAGAPEPSSGVSAQSGALKPAPPTALDFVTGTAGDVYLTGTVPLYSTVGVLAASRTASPWVVAKTGGTTAASAFGVYNSADQEIMRVGSDGGIRMAPSSFLSGRSDYFETPTIATNTVHDVTILNPRDAAGGSAARVVFFNAWTGEENGSPPLTKFQAYTSGYYAQNNINFDSWIHYHRGDQAHFRAWSTAEGKETFFVKAVSSVGDGLQGTRADMYVSGKAAIGRLLDPQSFYTFDVLGAMRIAQTPPNDTTPALASLELSNRGPGGGEYRWSANTASAVASNGIAANGYEIWEHPAGGLPAAGIPRLVMRKSLTSVAAAPVIIDQSGKVGIGGVVTPTAALDVQGNVNVSGDITGARVINAVFQDLAEWVPVTESMAPGTVVVVDPDQRNAVMPSSTAYDTSVAGVVSARPGVLLGVASPSKAMIATTGRVMVRVDAGRGSIRAGDLLVTSDKPGVAMRSEPIDIGGVKFHRPGSLIGKALEPLEGGVGEILVLLSLQ
ncbi:MAG: hypothetical protein AABO58_09130 [Acidobacteriota bacterium]